VDRIHIETYMHGKIGLGITYHFYYAYTNVWLGISSV
jgi:hypothetical protein